MRRIPPSVSSEGRTGFNQNGDMNADLDITPQPSPAEEEAIRRALARLRESEDAPPGAWWRAGVLGEDSEESAPEG